MGWVSSPPLFCAASKTAADLSNSYLANPETHWRSYAPSKYIYATDPNYTASDNRIQKVEVYMDDFKGITQGDPDQKERVTELLLRDIKEIFLLVPEEIKDSVSLKKALQGNGYWLPVREILGWIFNTKQGTFQLPEKRRLELQELLDVSSNQRRISVDKLRLLIGKLRSLNLMVPGAIGHFCHIQTDLTHAGTSRRAYILKGFHPNIAHWIFVCIEVLSRPTFISEIVQRMWTALGFCDASGKGAGGCVDLPEQ